MKSDLMLYQAPGAGTPLLDNTLFARIINSLCIPMCVIDACDLTQLTANAAARADAAFWQCANRCSRSAAGSSAEASDDCAAHRALVTRAHAVREHKRADANGAVRTYEMHAHPILGSEGNLIFIVEYMIDVTDRSRAEQSRRESDERFRQVAENAVEWIWEVDPNGVYRYCNPMVQQVLGYAPDELVGKMRFYDLFAPSIREELKNAALAAFERREQFRNFVNPNVHKDGSLVILETSGVPVLDDAGNLLGYRGTDLDVTARIEYERQLRQYSDIVLSMQVGLYVYRLDDPGNDESLRLVALNPASLATIGLPEEKILGRRIDQVFPDLGKLGIYRQFADVARTGIPFENKEFHYGSSNVKSSWFAFKAFPLPDDCVGVLFEDITERKRMEEALHRAKDYAENLIRTANALVVVLDANGSIQVFNEAAERITGYSLEELKNHDWFETLCPKDRYPDVWEVFSRLSRGGLPKNFENPILTKSGEERYIVWQNNEIKEQGRAIGSISFGIDITERKRAEEEIKQAEEKLKSIVEASGDQIFLIDRKGTFLFANKSVADRFDRSINDVIGKTISDLLSEPTADQFLENLGTVFQTGQSLILEEEIIIHGKEFFASTKLNPIKDEAGETWAVAGNVRDMTDRMHAERSKQRDKAFLDQLIETASEGIVVCDNDSRVLRINSEFQRMFGYSHDEAVGKLIDDLVASDGARDQACEISRDVAGGKRIDFEAQRRRKNGSIIDVSVIASPIVIDGKQVAFYGIYRDITDRKQAEEAERREKAFLDQLIETAREGIVVCDNDGRVVRINNEFRCLFGYSRDEAVGRPIDDLVAPAELRDLAAGVTGDVADGKRIDFEAQRRRKNGSIIDVSVIASPIVVDGEQVAVYAIYRDITDRKQAEEAEQREKAFLDQLIETASEGIVVASADGRVLRINDEFLHMFGYSRDEVVGKPIDELVAADESGDDAREATDSVAKRGRMNFDTRRRRKDGSGIDVSVIASPIVIDGKQVAAYAIYRDITDRIEGDRKLRQAKEEAEQANRAKSQFIANVSHEIRTPMNAIIGFTEMMLDDELTNEQREHAEIVKMSAETLLSLINDILDFSKIEAGRLELENVAFEPEPIAHEVCQLICSNIASKRIELLCDVSDRVPSKVRGDPFRFRQVLTNLLSNACKFTDAGEIELAMDVEQFEADRIKLHVTVRDTGISIPADKLSLIFAPFRQADESTTRKHGGTGLGLTICRQTANLLGGDVWAESEEGAGSTFHFTAWLGKAGTVSDEQPASRQAPFKKMLLVDDNERALDIITRRFVSLGQQVVSRNSRAGAIEALQEALAAGSPFDICILDATMVTDDGCGTIAELRRLCGDAHCSMVGIALLIGREAKRCVHGHFDAHLHKPVRRRDCIELLRACAEGARSANPSEAHEETPGDAPDPTAGASKGTRGKRAVRILLAEDNPVNQKLAKLLLEKAGYAVEVASNGREAVEKFVASPDRYGLIFMDIQMPLMDGLEATKAIREKGFSAIPIVAMTARAMSSDHDSCLQAGMTDYITKPIRKDIVLEMVEKLTRSAAL